MNTTAEVKMWGTSIDAVTLPEGQKYASKQCVQLTKNRVVNTHYKNKKTL